MAGAPSLVSPAVALKFRGHCWLGDRGGGGMICEAKGAVCATPGADKVYSALVR